MLIRNVVVIALLGLSSSIVACKDDSSPDRTGPRDCPGGIVGNLQSPAQITIAGLNPGDRNVRGTARNIDARIVKVVLWAKTDRWYVQPLIAEPFTEICSDGSWSNWTHPWLRMVALLVDGSYVPGATREYHPSADHGVLAWSEYPGSSANRLVNFSGYEWRVKSSELKVDPGPNWFGNSADNVWTSTEGLHLKIDYSGGRWNCGEVVLTRSLGYGAYTFQVVRRIDALDARAVFAGFIYESNSREVDIEFSRALAQPQNAQYVVQPYTRPGNIHRFNVPSDSTSSHRFTWRPDRIEFVSWRGLDPEPVSTTLISSWIYTGPDIPPQGGERMRFNLWLVGGEPPMSGQSVEVVLKLFTHSP